MNRATDLREDRRAQEENEKLNRIPTEAEIMKAIKETRESAPGEDGVRINYIKYACDDMKAVMVELVQLMFQRRANEWSEGLKTGVIVPLFKKGDRGDVNNYRGVCLLAMGSRILARIIAKRVGVWAETLKVLDENQAGFRRGRSTADIVQVMVRIEEDTRDWKRREEQHDLEERNLPAARLLGLTKTYPRVNNDMWMHLERYGMKSHCLKTIMDLHEATSYKVRGMDGMSEE